MTIFAVFFGVITLGGSLHAAWWLTGQTGVLPLNPLELVLGTISKKIFIPVIVWVLTAVFCVLAVVVPAVVYVVVMRRRPNTTRGDDAARLTGRREDMSEILEPATRSVSERVFCADPAAPIGVRVARAVGTGLDVWQSWEKCSLDIWGPRTGKTTSRAIPMIVDAPGAVLVTSNKRDVADSTRGIRERHGHIWIMDPQGIVDDEPTFWFDPLDYIRSTIPSESRSERADRLAGVFQDAAPKDPGRSNSEGGFFPEEGKALASVVLLAAAVGNRPLADAFRWVADGSTDEPELILRDHGLPLKAADYSSFVSLVPETKSGVFAEAKRLIRFVADERANMWISPNPILPKFDFEAFPISADTLYALSQAGGAASAPVVASMTIIVCEMAKAIANRGRGGRLPVPMVVCLDEAANVVPWKGLPSSYSYYGSKGIVVSTILQSYAQGVQAWGEQGMKQLWDNSNLKLYGGGAHEPQFLKMLQDLIGTHYIDSVSTSRGEGRVSTSVGRNATERPIITAAQLAALPRGRAWVFAHGATPVLCATLPWFTGPHAAAINASVDTYEPKELPAEQSQRGLVHVA